jgi:hypothetical protein
VDSYEEVSRAEKLVDLCFQRGGILGVVSVHNSPRQIRRQETEVAMLQGMRERTETSQAKTTKAE